MKTFRCHCGNTLHFENSQCMVCGRTLGYVSEDLQLSALDPADGDQWQALSNGRLYKKCANYQQYNICNWLVSIEDNQRYCPSCRLNRIIPNLGEEQNLKLWYRIEAAKRRLLYTLCELGLPIVGRVQDPKRGLAFEFMEDQPHYDEFSNSFNEVNRVMTGHHSGIITINIMEAEDSAREMMREQMKEGYRTLLGHFRHEIGHYYWDRLVNGTEYLAQFRELFGDERIDYQQALQDYYQRSQETSWRSGYISAYASSHPWEDWAETWAHYLHMVDTLETANDAGFTIEGHHASAPAEPVNHDFQQIPGESFDALMGDWSSLVIGLNALNRSMGLPDAYPFILSAPALNKLRFVHQLVTSQSD